MKFTPNTPEDQARMLKSFGGATPSLFREIPRPCPPLHLPPPLSEPELMEKIRRIAKKNYSASPFLGGGCYSHFIPSAVKHIISRSEFYTAYTPYQAEMSQGILQVIYEFQSMLCALTGMDAANASMYDGATALAEAAFLACRVTGRTEILVSSAVHPNYRRVLKTYANGSGLSIKEAPYAKNGGTVSSQELIGANTACFILQQPNFFGCIENPVSFTDFLHANGSLFIVCVDPISLGILSPPGDYGADVVVGEGASLGNSPAFGGPGLGLFAVKKDHLRQLPGRVVGRTLDQAGSPGFCLTLQTREQHIRRERATSNICSNEALAALAAAVYLALMGKSGLKTVAKLCLLKSNYLKTELEKKGVKPRFTLPTFKEFAVRTNRPQGLPLAKYYPELSGVKLFCVTELTPKKELDVLVKEFS